MISRRDLLRYGVGMMAGLAFFGPRLSLGVKYPHFFFAQLKYRGGDWDPYPEFTEAIVEELELRTSVDALKERKTISLSDSDLFFCPFLYMCGKYEFDPFTSGEREILRRFLAYGGFLFAEDTLGVKGGGFDRAFRREMKQVLPNHEMSRLPLDHSVYQSFYMIGTVGGRQRVNPYLEGITIGRWTPVIYSQNDLAGAWMRDLSGKWMYDCVPGGEPQRALAFRTGINIIVYSLTSDYKKDVIHHPFIKRRQGL